MLMNRTRLNVVAIYCIVLLPPVLAAFVVRWAMHYDEFAMDRLHQLAMVALLASVVPTFLWMKLSGVPRPSSHRTVAVTASAAMVLCSAALVVTAVYVIHSMGKFTDLRCLTESAYFCFADMTGLLGVGLAMWSVSVLGITMGRVVLSAWIIVSGFYWVALSDHHFYLYQVSNVIALHAAIVGVFMNHRIRGKKPSWFLYSDVALVAIATFVYSLAYKQPDM